MEDFKKEPLVCPKCNSDNIDSGQVQTDVGSAWRTSECEDCGATWKEVYTFSYWEYED